MTRKTFAKLVMFGLAALVSVGAPKVASAQILNIPVIILYPPPHFTPFPTGITAGFEHTCVRKSDSSVYCWGVNSSGETGVPSTANCIQGMNFNSPFPCVDKPQLVLATGMSQVAAGDTHTCALTTTGGVTCWGGNGFGQVGNNYNNQSAPQVLATNSVFSLIAAGGNTSCGISSTGTLCWGQAPQGTFLGVPNQPNFLNTFTQSPLVTVGNQFVCSLIGGSSSLLDVCLGANGQAQLGVDPNVTGPSAKNIFASSMNGNPLQNVRIAAGRDFHCVEHTNGTVQCAGDNLAGQLGLGFTSSREWSVLPVGGTQPMQLHSVAAGWTHACALDAGGHAFCWGSGDAGQLGNGKSGSGYYATTPQQVVGANGVAPTFRALAAGSEHTCGIGTDNYIYCWGDNTFGQIGAGLNNIGSAGLFGGYATFTATAVRTAGF